MIITSLWDIREVRSERVLIAGHTADLHAPTKELGQHSFNKTVDWCTSLGHERTNESWASSKEQRWGIVGASCGVALGDLR